LMLSLTCLTASQVISADRLPGHLGTGA